MSADLTTASIVKNMSGLGGSGTWEEFIANYKGTDLDLIKRYVEEDDFSAVEAIYIAMKRAEQ
jgi:hypothetical protein